MIPLLEVRGLSHRYPDGRHGLRDCSLALQAGSRNALLGANGSGKTTLLQHLNGLLRPSGGQLLLAGQPFDYSRAGLTALRRRVGIVFQNPEQQLLAATVFEDVSFGPLNLGLEAAQVRGRAVAALEAVGLAGLADQPVQSLSHGQKKRVCIAGVLAMEPDLLLLDEPMAGLDAAMQEELLAVLEQLAGRGVSLLLSTHDVDFAYRWADAIHLLQGGCCIASFAAGELPEQSAVLQAAGQPLPAVLPLHRHLVEQGLLAAGPVPRSLAALQAALRADCPKREFEPGGTC